MKRILLIIILCFGLCLIAKADESKNTPAIHQGFFAKYFKKTKDWGAAYKNKLEIKYYKELLKKNPNDIETLQTFGKYLKDNKYYSDSLKIYEKLFSLTKDDKYKADIVQIKSFQAYKKKDNIFGEYIRQAKQYESRGQIAKANEYYLKAQKIFPDRYETKFGLAKTYSWLNKPKLASQNYQELLKSSPDNVDLLESYSEYLKTNNDYFHAKEIYKKLLAQTQNEKYKNKLKEIDLLEKGYFPKETSLESAQSPQDIAFFVYLKQAQQYESQGNIPKANEYYLKAQKESPERYEAKFGLAKTYGWLNQTKLAMDYYQELLKETPNPDLIKAYKKFLSEKKAPRSPPPKTTNALSKGYQIQAGNTKNDSLFSSHIKQAQAYENQGNAIKANEYYLKAEKIYPSRYEAKFGLAKTFGWLHKDDLALTYYKELLQQSPNNVDLLEAYANYLKDNKDYTQAMELYDKLLAQTKNEKYNMNKAEVFFMQKDYQSSLALYQELYDKNPNDPQLQKSMGLVYFTSGDFVKSVEFYQKYLAQKQDPESTLNYGKSLFYSKNIPQAKEVLENHVKNYPEDVDALSTLSDINVALKQIPQAVELINQALALEPDNIKLQIQSAKIDIAAKNYIQANNLLLKLLKNEPNNPDILENLGDIKFYTADFNKALCYYQSIPDFKNIQRINYKIAQSQHYNKNYGLAEYLYGQLLQDPEYSNKAQIGLAEIKISEDKPLHARAILNNVLATDPQNVQAQKNMAISFFSTGDNFKSIKILEALPKDDSDINYNLAKAYNKIDRKDVALDILKDNPQENAKELEKEILMQIRPAVEPIYNLYRMTGNANAGKYQKGGANTNFYPRPNLKAIISILTTEYKNVTNIVATNGTLYSVGMEGRPHNKMSYKTAIGIDKFSNNGDLLLGESTVKLYPNDVLTWTSGYIRSLDEIDSYMSAAGVIPTTGPFANQLVGRIIDNKFIVGNIGLKLPRKFYAYAAFNMGNKYGYNSPQNSYCEIPAGFGKVVHSAAEDKRLNQALVAYDFYYTAYASDRSGFGGANLNYNPVGSDGGSPIPTTGNPGVGGYFSPTLFIANKIPVTIKGTFKKINTKYSLMVFGGTQTIRGQIGLLGPGGGGSNIRTDPYYGYLVSLNCNEKGRYGVRLDYSYNNYFTIAQHLFRVNFLIRF